MASLWCKDRVRRLTRRTAAASLGVLVAAMTVAARPALGAVFSAVATYSAPSNTSVLSVHDFNSDGLPDVLVQDTSSGQLRLFAGDGAGALTEHPITNRGYGEAVDLNGDAVPDVVDVGFGGAPAGVFVLEQLADRAGGFGAPQNVRVFTGTLSPGPFAVGNFSGKGKADVIFEGTPVSAAPSLYLTPGSGDGTFGAITWSHDEVQYSRIFNAGDLNGDGADDIAVEDAHGNVSVLLSDGHGGFGTPQGVASGVPGRDVVAADLDGDGIPELVIATPSCIAVYKPVGPGQLHQQGCYATDSSAVTLAVADFNGDGIPDVLYGPAPFSNGHSVGVLFGDGTGGLAGGSESFLLQGYFHDFKVGDLNGDGRPDVVIGTGLNDFLVLLNTSAPEATPGATELDFPTEPLGVAAPKQTVTLQSTGEQPFTVTSTTLTGPSASDYSVASDSCTRAVLLPGDDCTVGVVFKPSAPGARTATLVFKDTAPNGPQQVALVGNGRTPPSPPVTPAATLPSTAFTTVTTAVDSRGGLRFLLRAPGAGVFDGIATTRSASLASEQITVLATAKRCGKRICRTATTIYGTGKTITSTAANARLLINPNAKARRALARRRTLHVTVMITFRSAAGGTPTTRRFSLTVKR